MVIAERQRSKPTSIRRRLPVGAELQPEGGVHFRAYAPLRQRVVVVFEDSATDDQRELILQRDEGGYHAGLAPNARAGMRYRLKLDDLDGLFADPASRFQPEGCKGPSQIFDPSAFEWHDADWHGVTMPDQIIYELHIGTFTREGTWAAATERLPHLVELGITVVEVMPVAEFPGRFGWGYDGVVLFAPTRLYGGPDDFRRFVDEAHRLKLGVILDVVYNHFGPADNYCIYLQTIFIPTGIPPSGATPSTSTAKTPDPRVLCSQRRLLDRRIPSGWVASRRCAGDHRRFARSHSGGSRGQARKSPVTARSSSPPKTSCKQSRMLRSPNEGGFGLDAGWNDDFHHAARVAMTGQNDAYYADYDGTPQEIISAVKWGYLYQGQWNAAPKKFRGQPTWGIPAHSFVVFLQNHDQVANSLNGGGSNTIPRPAAIAP